MGFLCFVPCPMCTIKYQRILFREICISPYIYIIIIKKNIWRLVLPALTTVVKNSLLYMGPSLYHVSKGGQGQKNGNFADDQFLTTIPVVVEVDKSITSVLVLELSIIYTDVEWFGWVQKDTDVIQGWSLLLSVDLLLLYN